MGAVEASATDVTMEQEPGEIGREGRDGVANGGEARYASLVGAAAVSRGAACAARASW